MPRRDLSRDSGVEYIDSYYSQKGSIPPETKIRYLMSVLYDV